ncbi:hypothetical protein FGLOB1_11167 [Fusarium globosum]|uniref:C2H2-type domain-containing protein n=1 Tax=Fusarium globosum TaxID=78864 RepID=A0A8H5XUY1_9HYPO|nr:hypothetical protein FGLOB1_11167 [Fusarium globosum]
MDHTDKPDFETVLKSFNESLDKRDLERFRATTLNLLIESIENIQTRQQANKRLRNLNRLAPFLEAAKQYGEVVRSFCNSNDIMPLIWGPMKFILEVTYLLPLIVRHGEVIQNQATQSQMTDLEEREGVTLPPEEAPFRCSHCSKVYSNKFNLTSHLHSHTDEQRFACGQCTKAFARLSDLKRHEERHQKKQHVCRGVLRNGATWGCGKAFSRDDFLKAHHKSEAGQRCILPFEQEENYIPTHLNALHENYSVDDTIDDAIKDPVEDTISDISEDTSEDNSEDISEGSIEDTNTEYSTSSTNFPKANTYIETFARHLASHTCGLLADKTTKIRISNMLPSLLKAFSVQVGHQTHLPLNRKAMAFIYREISEAFENIQFDQDISQRSTSDDDIDRRGFLNAWIDGLESPSGYLEDEQSHQEDEDLVEVPLSVESFT